jgi:hypothetical protein
MCHLRKGLLGPNWVITSQYCYGAFICRIATISGGSRVQTVDRRRFKGTNEGLYHFGFNVSVVVLTHYSGFFTGYLRPRTTGNGPCCERIHRILLSCQALSN